MQTLGMQGIADLAQVKRPVVSMWRTRYATSDLPFPAPVQNDPLRFDAAEVAAWLRDTGRGNNPDADVESPLHSDKTSELFQDPETTSALLLMHELHGAALPTSADTKRDALLAEIISDARSLPVAILSPEAAKAALNSPQVQAANALAEAAFSGAGALDLLVRSFEDRTGAWADEALTATARQFLSTVLSELFLTCPDRALVPAGPGGLALTGTVLDHLGDTEQPTIAFHPEDADSSAARAALRRLLAHHLTVAPYRHASGLSAELDPHPTLDTESFLHLFQWQNPTSDDGFFDAVDNLLLDLHPGDVLVILGPSRLMSDPAAATARMGILNPRDAYSAPLRYTGQLPKGMSRFGGRRRLSLWVFGNEESSRTVCGEYSGLIAEESLASNVAADVAVSVTDDQTLRSHAFQAGSLRQTSDVLARTHRATPVDTPAPRTGGELLAKVWELDDGDLDGLRFSAGDEDIVLISFEDAVDSLARDLAGVRLPAEHIQAPEAGSVVLIGPDEIHDPSQLGHRAIDRLVLESVAPQAQFTEPGDVVYVVPGARGPRAVVDRGGGHVVRSPARVFRCGEADRRRRTLAPDVVASDINSSHSKDRSAWNLRLVPPDHVSVIDQVSERIAQKTSQFREQLRILEDLQETVLDGLAGGALHPDNLDSDSDNRQYDLNSNHQKRKTK